MINRFKNLNPSFLNPSQSVSNYKKEISQVSVTWRYRTLKPDKMNYKRVFILTLGLGTVQVEKTQHVELFNMLSFFNL